MTVSVEIEIGNEMDVEVGEGVIEDEGVVEDEGVMEDEGVAITVTVT